MSVVAAMCAAARHLLTDGSGAGDQLAGLDLFEHSERGGARDRVTAVRAADAAGVGGVHDVGAAGDRGQRHPTGEALGRGDEVGHDAFVFAGEPCAGARDAGLHFVGDEHDAAVPAEVGHRPQEALGGDDEAALSLDRFDDDARDGVGADLDVDELLELGECLVGAVVGSRPATGRGRRRAPGTPRGRTVRSRALYGSFFAVIAMVSSERPWKA